MKTLAEINAERQEIINAGLENIGEKVQKEKIYSAEELSVMSGGLIPAKNIKASLVRGSHEVEKRYRPCSRPGIDYLYGGGIRVKPIKTSHILTYKVYDENGELVEEFKKNKRVVKAQIF